MAARDDMAAYMRARRARQKAEKEAIERAGGVPVFTTEAKANPSTGSGQVFGYRDGTKPRPAAPSALREPQGGLSRALTVRHPAPAPARASMVAGIAGGRRVPAGYDAGTYPITPPERPSAVNTIWQRNVENALIGLAMDNRDLRARVEELEAERHRRETSPGWQVAGFALLSMLGGWKRA